MEDEKTLNNKLGSNPTGKKDEKKKWPQYCKTMMVTDSHGAVKELVFPKALDLDRPKRERTTFSAQQLDRLEEEFRLNQYLVGKDRTALADNLGLTETQVKVWFQNRRTKHKKDREKRVEDGDHEAESQAAQNVLKLLEYKTAFSYSPVLSGTTGTSGAHSSYEPLDMSNTGHRQQVASGPSAAANNLMEISSCHTRSSCSGLLHIDSESKERIYCRERISGSGHETAFLQRPYLAKTSNPAANSEKLLAMGDDNLRQQRQNFSEVVKFVVPPMQHSQTANNPTELFISDSLRMSTCKNPSDNRYFSSYQALADPAFSTIQNRPFLHEKQLVFDNRNVSYPFAVSGASYTPANYLCTPHFFSLVHSSVPTTHNKHKPKPVMCTLPAELSQNSGSVPFQTFNETH